MTRKEHLKWAKDRAIEYLKENNMQEAAASFISDMGKHPENFSPLVAPLIMRELLHGNAESLKKCIEGFN